MSDRKALKGLGLGMLAALVIAVGLRLPASANDAAKIDSPVGVSQSLSSGGVHVVPAAAFHAAYPDSVDGYLYWPVGYVYSTQSAETNLVAPVYLPDGAHVYKVRFTWYDNNPAGRIQVWLQRAGSDAPYDVGTLTLFQTSDSMAYDYVVYQHNRTISFPRVDQSKYTYYVYLRFNSSGAETRLYSVQIYYMDHSVFLPCAIKDS
jgi:hypothetical protein